MIISASRRTDIPSFYSEWFFNRIKEGFVLVRNPMNYHQVSKVNLKPDVVDGIVFWTKNPLPMLDRLSELKDYMFYFQFTITPYGTDIEPNIPSKTIDTFKRLADIIGPERVIWRYDPIFINENYTYDYHLNTFGKIANELKGYTNKIIFSFIAIKYREVKRNIKRLALQDINPDTQIKMAEQLAQIAKSNNLQIESCADTFNLEKFGIGQARCIDDKLFGKLLGCELDITKDKNQRTECGCITSIDIGMYNTCLNGCLYCYANYSKHNLQENHAKHDTGSPLLSGYINEEDKISERITKSNRNAQLQLRLY